MVAAGASNPKKIAVFDKIQSLFKEHSQILLINVDNVGSAQLANIRYALRGVATVLMGKNTMIRTALNTMKKDYPHVEQVIPALKQNVGLVFCNNNIADVRKVILDFKKPAPAKVGTYAPCDVFIPAGPTGMDPGATSFFQALQIPTKIVKGKIEIQNEVHVIKKDDKINASQVVLLQKLNICPFSYGVKTLTVFDEGVSYPASVLDIKVEEIVKTMEDIIHDATSFALGAGIPTSTSVAHMLCNVYQETLYFGLGAELSYKEIESIKEAIENASNCTYAPVVEAQVESVTAAVEEEKEESDDDMGFGLFD